MTEIQNSKQKTGALNVCHRDLRLEICYFRFIRIWILTILQRCGNN